MPSAGARGPGHGIQERGACFRRAQSSRATRARRALNENIVQSTTLSKHSFENAARLCMCYSRLCETSLVSKIYNFNQCLI